MCIYSSVHRCEVLIRGTIRTFRPVIALLRGKDCFPHSQKDVRCKRRISTGWHYSISASRYTFFLGKSSLRVDWLALHTIRNLRSNTTSANSGMHLYTSSISSRGMYSSDSSTSSKLPLRSSPSSTHYDNSNASRPHAATRPFSTHHTTTSPPSTFQRTTPPRHQGRAKSEPGERLWNRTMSIVSHLTCTETFFLTTQCHLSLGPGWVHKVRTCRLMEHTARCICLHTPQYTCIICIPAYPWTLTNNSTFSIPWALVCPKPLVVGDSGCHMEGSTESTLTAIQKRKGRRSSAQDRMPKT